MSTDTGENLLNPGDTPHDNAQFLVFCVAVIRAVAKYPRDCCACRSRRRANDHRLGANEAPPAIISIFLGDQLNDVIEQLEKGGAKSTKQGGFMRDRRRRCCRKLPQGRRRPQPHQPVRLHRQQVRVPRRRLGSQSIAGPNTVLNTIVAESLDYIATKLEKPTSRAART